MSQTLINHREDAAAGRIVFDKVGKTYPGKNGSASTQALAGLSFTVQESEIVSVLGPTGCGKSSALNLIAGFEAATEGRVMLNGQPVQGCSPERAIVFQNGALFPWLNVLENMVLGVKARGVDKDDYLPRAHALINEVGLRGFEKHYPYQLSGGMQQRVQIARAMLGRPRTLLMDEPFGALDYQTRIQMQELLLQLWQEHRPTVFFITHDVGEAIFVSDRVLVMSSRPGRIAFEVRVNAAKPRSQNFLSDPEFVGLQQQLLHAVQQQVHRTHSNPPPIGLAA